MTLVTKVFVYIALASLSFLGCKNGHWKKAAHDSERKSGGVVVEPRKISDADATAAAQTIFEIDEKTGRIKQSLVLRLDYFPKTEKSGTNLPACYGAFPPEFQLGSFSCTGQPGAVQPLQAGHVSQDCYTNPRFTRVQPSTPIVLPGCTRGALVLHAFDPQMRVDVEQREAM